jgi:hypothetical protein
VGGDPKLCEEEPAQNHCSAEEHFVQKVGNGGVSERQEAGKEVVCDPELCEEHQDQNHCSAEEHFVQKVIGSGRVEKGCALVIANRQKHKNMSWGKLGSLRSSILKVMELNQRWEELWFPRPSPTTLCSPITALATINSLIDGFLNEEARNEIQPN